MVASPWDRAGTDGPQHAALVHLAREVKGVKFSACGKYDRHHEAIPIESFPVSALEDSEPPERVASRVCLRRL